MRELLTILAFAAYLTGCNNEQADNQEKDKTVTENKTSGPKEEAGNIYSQQ